MSPRDQQQEQPEQEYGAYFKPEVKNIIKLSLAFAKAVGTHQEDKANNLVVSPYNAVACLSMVGKGADGQTREEIAKALFNTDSKGLDEAAGAYAALNQQILDSNKGQVDIITANAVWTNERLVELRESFADDLKKTFAADITAENYADPATLKKINDWASQNTKGLINQILEELNPEDAAVLASALYFKAPWTRKFDKKLTEDKTFAVDGAEASLTPTMHQDFEEGISYLKGKDYEAVSLTYGEESYDEQKYPTMRVVLLRPNDDNVSARDWLAQQKDAVPEWLDTYAFQAATGSVELPKLDIKQKHDIIPVLEDLGIKQAFKEGAADFTRMVEKDGKRLYVSKVSHDVAFKTDEEGSEGAAVTTAVVTFESCAMPSPRIDIKLDRSFVFAVQDLKSGAVLFMGAINKPNDEMKAAPQKGHAPKL